ncbi:hypothetical protein EWI07_00055 [Sporolactobacillus sp. THM7-4]|nr:hypothetical protein EWI07_00055 [Sporolactobacillus sp. THM7-4]
MNVHQLLIHYPGTIVKKKPFKAEQTMLYFYEEPYYIGIPSENLSDREIYLLKTLLNQEIPPVLSRQAQFWYNILIEGKIPEKYDPSVRVRIIHFQVTGNLSGEALIEWRRAFEAFFDSSVSFIYLSSKQGLIIEKNLSLTEEGLLSITNTLENDFSVKCRFLIGLRYPLSPMLRNAYLEESRLFNLNKSRSKRVVSVETAFFLLLIHSMKKQAVLAEIRTILDDHPEWVSMIRALWNHQGNISLTAKHLYMHRNTLQYRIEKFYELSGISLRRMDGLTITFLASL